MRRAALIAALAGTFLARTPVLAQNDDAGLSTGKDEFIRHCALCHGLDASGNGPLAAALQTNPTDLTRLAVDHNDRYPAAKIADVIRNGGGVLGHGSTAMLAWGNYFAEKGKPEVARARIKALVAYIESIQQK
jgi:mono/diheme cytochrome c family protein